MSLTGETQRVEDGRARGAQRRPERPDQARGRRPTLSLSTRRRQHNEVAPKGAASGESYEADAQRVNLRGRYKEAEEVSLAAETPLQVFSFAGEGRR